MKRQLIYLILILPFLSVAPSLKALAQDGNATLEGSKTNSGGKDSKSTSVSGPPMLAFGKEIRGKLDPRSSKNAAGSFFEDMILKAGSDDSLLFSVKSEDPSLSSSLELQIFGKNNAEVAVAKDLSGNFKIATITGGLPANGDYRVRVTGALNGKSAIPFTIKVDRLGMTGVAYVERFNKIYMNYNENDPASVDDTVAKLERLAKDAPNHSTAFERLGIIYLEKRQDKAKAEWALNQAINVNGAARIAIAYDSKWRQMTKLRSGGMGFEDKRIGWLRIQTGALTLYDSSNKPVLTLTGQQIKDVSLTVVSAYNLVTINPNNNRKPYIFAPEAMRQVEADLVVSLINNHVVGKAM